MMKLIVDNGRVNCPRQGDVDMDECIECPDLVDIRDEDGRSLVICRARPRSRFLASRIWTGFRP